MISAPYAGSQRGGYPATVGASAPDSRKSSKVLGVDAERHAGAGLHAQRLDDCVTRRAEDLNLRRRVERLVVGLGGPLADQVHVELHRGRIRMDLHNGHLAARGIDVLVEGEQTRLPALDEVDESGHAAALRLVRGRLEPV